LAHINSQNGGRGLSSASRYYAEGGSVVTSGTDIELVARVVKETVENLVIVTQVEDIQTGLNTRDEVINAGVIS
jgi:2-keto-3-deoxy-L-rhamnonate aldolase RhmA